MRVAALWVHTPFLNPDAGKCASIPIDGPLRYDSTAPVVDIVLGELRVNSPALRKDEVFVRDIIICFQSLQWKLHEDDNPSFVTWFELFIIFQLLGFDTRHTVQGRMAAFNKGPTAGIPRFMRWRIF